MNKLITKLGVIATAVIALAACGNGTSSTADSKVTIGVMEGSSAEIWRDVATRLEDQNVTLEVKTFTDYNTPNEALANGDLDLNAFQHIAFLENFNANTGNSITPIGFTFVSPFGIYSNKVDDTKSFKDGDTISIPNDATNGGRALYLLETLGLIELPDDLGAVPTVSDITNYKVKITIQELDAAQLAASLEDVTAACINTNFAVDAGLSPNEDALFLDTDNIESLRDVYKNVIAARDEDKDNEAYNKVVAEYQTDRTKELIAEYTKNTDIPAW